MKIIMILVMAAVAFFGYQYYQENIANANPLIGTWQSDKDKSIAKFREAGITRRQQMALESILGKMTFTITESEWTSNFNGQVEKVSYEIVSEDGGCYGIKQKSDPVATVCVVADELHVPTSLKGAKEVFVRK